MRKRILVIVLSICMVILLLNVSFMFIHKGNVCVDFLIFPPIDTVDYDVLIDDSLLFHDTITDGKVKLFKDCFFLKPSKHHIIVQSDMLHVKNEFTFYNFCFIQINIECGSDRTGRDSFWIWKRPYPCRRIII